MDITVRRITDLDLLKECLEFVYNIEASKMTEALAYHREHSIVRTQLFLVKMKDIPTKVSVHLVRHAAVGQFHLVGSNRYDLGEEQEGHKMTKAEWDAQICRDTPVNHVMLLNGQHLIEMARKRLCNKAELDTNSVMQFIKEAVYQVSPDLANAMVPNCYYRGGICPEPKSCGLNVEYLKSLISIIPESYYRDSRNEKAVKERGLLIQ